MLTLQIGNIYTDILGEIPDSHWKGLERKLSFRPEGYQFSPAFNRLIRNSDGQVVRRMWDGWKRLCWKGKKRTYFPTGLLSITKEYFKEHGIVFQVNDIRERPDPIFELELKDGFSFRPYQIDYVIPTACNKTRGVIRAPTGSGKTAMSAGIIKELKVSPFVFFVTSIDLLEQAKESLSNILRFSGSPLQVGQIGGGIVDIRDVNVITVQTAVRALGEKWDKNHKFDDDDTDDKTDIEKYRKDIQDLIRSAKGAISDEIQHWKAETCQFVARELKSAYYTFGLSATPWRDEGDDLMIQACFGKEIVKLTASELIRQGYLVKPEIKMVHIKDTKSYYKTWQSIYKDQVVENAKYNGMIANIANAYVQNGRYTLILVKQLKHGEIISSMIPNSKFLSGSCTKEQRKNALQDLRDKKISCICASVIFDEGIDVTTLDTVILAGQGKCVSRDTTIYSDCGLLKMYEINRLLVEQQNVLENTFVQMKNRITVDSMFSRTSSTHFYFGGTQKCCDITLENGTHICGTLDHRLRILRNGKIRYCKTSNIRLTDRIIIKKNSQIFGQNRFFDTGSFDMLPACQPITVPGKMIPKLARFIAYSLCEGYVVRDDCIEISNVYDGDEKEFSEIFQMFNYPMNKVTLFDRKGPTGRGHGWLYRVSYKNLIKFMRFCGVESTTSRFKQIPLCIRTADRESYLSFLQGVFESEGSISTRCAIEITMASEGFIRDLQQMLLNIGILGRLDVRTIDGEHYYRIKIQGVANLLAFRSLIGFLSEHKRRTLDKLCLLKPNSNKNTIPGIKSLCKRLREQTTVERSTVLHKSMNGVITKLAPSSRSEFTHESLKRLLAFFADLKTTRLHLYLTMLCNKDFEYIGIKKITERQEVVYDIETDRHHYIANGTISHNSKVRAMQRIGRIMRPHPGKTKATAIDFCIHQKYLKDHALAREKMYRTEEEYSIEDIHPNLT